MDKLQNELNYGLTLKRMWDLTKLKPNKCTKEGNELDMLTTLVEAY